MCSPGARSPSGHPRDVVKPTSVGIARRHTGYEPVRRTPLPIERSHMPPPRHRILLAIDPPLLADTVAVVLAHAGQDEVEVLRPGTGTPHGHYSGVIATIDLTGVDADVVIQLPDAEGGGGMGAAVTAAGSREVALPDVVAVLQLLDEHCAADAPRTRALDE